ncbi:MAG: hypothetical protein FWD44_09900 [Oscillospiraceae bacterium]|nr:hypothetical protein [Oscillospiraceae bacterium]
MLLTLLACRRKSGEALSFPVVIIIHVYMINQEFYHDFEIIFLDFRATIMSRNDGREKLLETDPALSLPANRKLKEKIIQLFDTNIDKMN